MQARPSGALRHVEGMTSLVSIALALAALAALPWPGLWSRAQVEAGGLWLLLWAALEGAFLAPLLPGLLAGVPSVVRATLRDGQISVAGRALVWLAAGSGLALGEFSWRAAPAYGLALVATLAALPAALGWGPFGAVPGLALSAAERAIDPAARGLVSSARLVRSLALTLAALALALPLSALPAAAAWPLLLGAALLFWLALRRLAGLWPRMTLHMALRFCWSRALPLAVAAIIYVVILSWA